MPHTKSAKKSLKQSLVRRTRNRAAKALIRNYAKKVRTQIDAKDVAGAEEALKALTKRLDQTVAKGIYHKNTAARMKSRLSAAIVKIKKQPAA
jgi:small subunit ribosomal protein S20